MTSILHKIIKRNILDNEMQLFQPLSCCCEYARFIHHDIIMILISLFDLYECISVFSLRTIES